MSWYKTGYGGIAEEEKRLAVLTGPPRLWVPVGGRREVVFLSEQPINIHEHTFKAGGSWNNHVTCSAEVHDSCPACEKFGPSHRNFIGFYTVMDTSQWTDKRGNVHQYEVKLLPAKLGSLKKFERKAADRKEAGGKGLMGNIWRLSRDTDKEPAIGGDYEFIREIADPGKLLTVAKYKGKSISEWYEKADTDAVVMTALKATFSIEQDEDGRVVRQLFPFNIFELLKPLDPPAMRQRLAGASVDNSGGGRTSGGSAVANSAEEEETPF